MISPIFRCAVSLAFAAIILSANAASQSDAMPEVLTGIWSDNDADGRWQCSLWRKDPVARDNGHDPLVGAVVITRELIHSYAEYGEGNFYRVERVDATGAGSWRVHSSLYIDTLPSEAPTSSGDDAPLQVTDTMTLAEGELVWTASGADARTLFRCGDLPR
ncbi:hypothetical protein [[Pseudomonas] boreopolis]|uniref:hypothetical protein n=1 Tax=Xanthomonas boreopolis TaxID=86183 RepID=UPI003D9B38A8